MPVQATILIKCRQRMCDARAAAEGCHAPAEVDIAAAAVGDATAATHRRDTGASGCATVSVDSPSRLGLHPGGPPTRGRADQYPKADFRVDDGDWDQDLESACRQAE
jgi:hypothetical protein